MKRAMLIIIFLALLAAATSLSPIQGTSNEGMVPSEGATAVITITMTPVKP